MEDGLRADADEKLAVDLVECLNPCSCGGWSQSGRCQLIKSQLKKVLILVLVEDGLRAPCKRGNKSSGYTVLILVLVEDGLRECISSHRRANACLNPCSCGGWSQRPLLCYSIPQGRIVLILVLVEDGLRELQKWINNKLINRLNPCSCGGWSQSTGTF